VDHHLADVDIPSGQKLIKGKTVIRYIGVQRKCYPPNFNMKLLFYFFNTPGNEITPGSDIVREYLQRFWHVHFSSFIKSKPLGRQ